MKTTPANLKLGIGLIALITAGVWIGASPTANRAASLRERIARTSQDLQHSKNTAGDIRNMADTLEEARGFAARSTKPLATGDETATLVYELSSFVRALEIAKHELRQERARVEDGVRVTPLVLTMEGSYPDVVAVIDRVHSLDRLLRVSRLSIDLPRGGAPGSKTLQIEIVIEAMSREGSQPVVASAGEGGTR